MDIYETYINIKDYCLCMDYEIDKHTYTITKKAKEPLNKNEFTAELVKYKFVAVKCNYGENNREYNILSNGYKPQYLFFDIKNKKYETAKEKKNIFYLVFIKHTLFTSGHDAVEKLMNLISDFTRVLFVIDSIKELNNKINSIIEKKNISYISHSVFKVGPLVPAGAPISIRRVTEEINPFYKKNNYPTISHLDPIVAYYGFEKGQLILLEYYNINCCGIESVINYII